MHPHQNFECLQFHKHNLLKQSAVQNKIFPSRESIREIRENLHLGKITRYTVVSYSNNLQDSSGFNFNSEFVRKYIEI